MNLKELIYDIQQASRDFSDNSFVDTLYIEHLINIYRAKYLHQVYGRRPVLEKANRQSIAFEMELVNSSAIPELIKTKRRILRSVDKLPNILTLGKKPAVMSVTSIDRTEPGEFELEDKSRAQYLSSSPFCGQICYIDTDEHMYIIMSKDENKFLKYLVIDAIYEDPRKAIYHNYLDEDGSENNIELEDYPIDMGLWVAVKSDIVKELLRELSTPLDLQSASNSGAANMIPTEGIDNQVKGQAK